MDVGHTIKDVGLGDYGCFFWKFTDSLNTTHNDYKVLPNPISSQSAQFKLYFPKDAIQLIPYFWYSLKLAFTLIFKSYSCIISLFTNILRNSYPSFAWFLNSTIMSHSFPSAKSDNYTKFKGSNWSSLANIYYIYLSSPVIFFDS